MPHGPEFRMPPVTAGSTRITLLYKLNKNPSDQLSWGEFVRLYGPIIRNWLVHFGLQEADALDVAQNVLIRLTSKLPEFQYDPSRSFRGWLKTLTHHAWHDFVTEANYRNRGSGDTGVLQKLQSLEARTDLARRVEAEFDKELLEMAMANVQPRVAGNTWEAFKLTAMEQLPPQEVADKLGMRVSQVYLAKHRVQKLIQEEIQSLDTAPNEP
jgi:RNA polymerase sigma-70 factor (ECF subfamily)